ncbi:hypothetical protein L7F22_024397 [Adiantum nelumboides]|nr:hypothetical protein [Adiantum nelumboides]
MRSLHEVIDEIAQDGKPVTRKIIDKLLRTCIKQKDVAVAKRLHTVMVSSQHVESALADQLIRFFLFNACLAEAKAVLDNIPSPAVHTWHAIISAYSEGGEKLQALNLYHRMQRQALVMPNAYIFSCVLKACSGLHDLLQGALTHSDAIIMSLESDNVVGTALVDLYCKCKRMFEAFSVFENIKSCNVITWNALLTGCVQNQQWVLTLSLFDQLQQEGVKPDRVTFLCIMKACGSLGSFERCKLLYVQIREIGLVSDVIVSNALIGMFAKSGELQQANEVLKILQVRDVVSWTSIIAGFVQHGHGFAALEAFIKMQQEGIRPEKGIHNKRIAFRLSFAFKGC